MICCAPYRRRKLKIRGASALSGANLHWLAWRCALKIALLLAAANEGLIFTMIRPLVCGAGGTGVWACIGPDCPINKNNKTPATGLEYLNFLKAARMDGNDKGRLRPNNGMSALFLYRKEIVGWIVVGKAESIVLEED